MSKRKIIGWGIAAVVVVPLLVMWAIHAVLGPTVEVVRVHRGPIVQTVVATGRVMAPSRVAVGSLVAGTVAEVRVDEGSVVHKGDLLVRIDDAQAQASLSEAQAALAEALARLGQLRKVTAKVANASVTQANLALERARLAYARAQRLQKAGSMSASSLDEARLAFEDAQAKKAVAEAQAAASAKGGSDELLAVATVARARAALDAAKARLDDTHIVSPIDGVVVTRAVEPGDAVQPGRTLLRIDKSGATQLVVNTDEKNLRYLRVGQKAIASADAFPSRTFDATITRIAPSIDPDRGTVEIRLSVPSPPPGLRNDMTVSVNMETARKKDALVAPATAIHELTGKRPWVLLVKSGHAKKVPVTLGLVGDEVVEIERGVPAGARLVPTSEAKVKPGARVRTTPAMPVAVAEETH